MLRKLFAFLNRDFTGRTWTLEREHPYFGRMIRFGSRTPGASYWEAELALQGFAKPFSITFQGTEDGPENSELAFCRNLITGIDETYAKCTAAFAASFAKLEIGPLPSNWREAFQLNGFSVPIHGDPTQIWEICFAIVQASRFFTAKFESGVATQVVVDG
jgi:hypothetical protein